MEMVVFEEKALRAYYQGVQDRAYRLFGAHITARGGKLGVRFAVWAPHAQSVSVVGDFNAWDAQANPMEMIADSGVWVLFISGIAEGALYKYAIRTVRDELLYKADPYAFYAECRPGTASVVCAWGRYAWQDRFWEKHKRNRAAQETPMLIYEVHLGSWRRKPDGAFLNYREAAEHLVRYAHEMHYTHIELMPLCEHPFDGSWGYQTTGYYAVTSRYGKPSDFMYLVDLCHRHGIGVILDWVPGHFCLDEHGLRRFDGGPLYESSDPRRAENNAWGTANFDYGKPEVQSFLISCAMFWFEQYHIDGLRVDAVSNMLYLDYERSEGEWEPNQYGENGNLEAVAFLKNLNEAVLAQYPGALMLAEESTTWPLISKPVRKGGLGFSFKWNMGWMNDMLRYMAMDPIYRRWHHNLVTFSLMYAFSENFVLPLSHDEVVHGKRSLLSKMPGDGWQKFAGLRAFLGYWLGHPGKKLLFMGGEFGQLREWKYDEALDWHLLDDMMHQKLHAYVKAANAFYCSQPALWEIDCDWQGFEWMDCNDCENSVIAFMRRGKMPGDFLLVVCNFTPVVRRGYRIGVPAAGVYREIFNSDWEVFGGSNVGNSRELFSEAIMWHDRAHSVQLTVPPLATVYFQLARLHRS